VRRLLLATTNRDKVKEIRGMLAGLPVELLGLDELAPIEAPEETGKTFEENARLKARYYAAAHGLTAIAEDSGLAIDALDGAPGVESARFGGADTTYPQKFAIIYERLRQRGVTTSPAQFVCAVAIADVSGILFETRGIVFGSIAPTPAGSGGFGYDPIFFYPPFGCTLAEVSRDQKATVSHRGAAFARVRQHLLESSSA
jgi:XTP/dITP diphosphohydrolase